MNCKAALPNIPRIRGFRLRALIGGFCVLWATYCCAQRQVGSAATTTQPASDPFQWPAIGSVQRPWAYWWWHGSAVDTTNLTRELQRYRDAGLGGVHIIPIYGTKGYEEKSLTYLSPQWMEMLRHTVTEAQRLGLGVDMTTGTGWCFGGPQVTEQEANALAVPRTFTVSANDRLTLRFDPKTTQAVVAFPPEGKPVELTDNIQGDGALKWLPPSGTWRVYAVSQRPSGQRVKRAGPGGQGHMLNLFYPDAVRHYLKWFDDAFSRYTGPKPRAMYHDSYEYRSDWSPDLFAQFEKRRGYRLQNELAALFGTERTDRAARVKSDYRETISEVMAEESLALWNKWSHDRGFITRNEAHGSPGNWLDLYAAADIPETEMFHLDRNKLVSKFASSAAHVMGKNLTASETGTWLKEHFTETPADMKYLLDDLFLSGVNHVFYHGTCYSPDEAAWPGWLFYASFEMNPRNSIWRDISAINDYAARCQAILQSGTPDNDILIYWPIYDVWHDPAGMAQPFTVHGRDWFEQQPIGKVAKQLWDRGYSFDYVSDRQLAYAKFDDGKIRMPGGKYSVVLVPETEHIPLETFKRLLALAESGAAVIFDKKLPGDVSGWGELDKRRAEFKKLIDSINTGADTNQSLSDVKHGKGRVLIGGVESALAMAGVARETLFDQPGLMCIRRAFDGGRNYLIANRSETMAVDGWMPIAMSARSAVVMDPMTGHTGTCQLRKSETGTEVRLQLQPGESVVVRCFTERTVEGPAWTNWNVAGEAVEITGTWQVKFLQGGPELPAAFESQRLASWTESGDTNAQRFAGTARYTIKFDVPAGDARPWLLDLGKVCHSARVKLNGRDLGVLVTAPFRVATGSLKPNDNVLEVEVTSTSANRIRDLDRRGGRWKIFDDINFVNIDYRPFNAANWPLAEAGLLGPVKLVPVIDVQQ